MYILTKYGIYQLMARYDGVIRRLLIKRVEILEQIAKFGGRELSGQEDLVHIHSVMKPLIEAIYEMHHEFARNDFENPETKEEYEAKAKEWNKRVHSRSEFKEWWDSLIQHQAASGVYDRVILRPTRD